MVVCVLSLQMFPLQLQSQCSKAESDEADEDGAHGAGGGLYLECCPHHMIQLVNLQTEQPTLAFYMGYYLSICLSYAGSSINPFLYILLSGNFRKCLPQGQRRVTEKEINNMESTLKQSFKESTWIIKSLDRLAYVIDVIKKGGQNGVLVSILVVPL